MLLARAAWALDTGHRTVAEVITPALATAATGVAAIAAAAVRMSYATTPAVIAATAATLSAARFAPHISVPHGASPHMDQAATSGDSMRRNPNQTGGPDALKSTV